ncbi:MAG: HypC/HybG/HupF family hydrogenase formation chaperone [Ignisphaera sp.]|nr:HypC/HybG/HupF family hydrogenase formation chaperone [Ignisphaera sp.]MCX8168276.1 HypC/HybG/HupF family hydrogenase formation chaperone [Ignisphaera sp.]MDW8086041.1 HypC/HybG/HupF family hydrogenase formation chaperone [Ignisphaera sp.]
MCLGVPAVVIDIDEGSGIVKIDYGDGIVREALLGISEERVARGDIVVIHAGVVVSKFSIEGLYEQIEFIRKLLNDFEDNSSLEGLIVLYQNVIQLAERLKGSDG